MCAWGGVLLQPERLRRGVCVLSLFLWAPASQSAVKFCPTIEIYM